MVNWGEAIPGFEPGEGSSGGSSDGEAIETAVGFDTSFDKTKKNEWKELSLGSGNNIIKLSSVDETYRLWIGDLLGASAPFSVTKAGALASSSGTIGGWVITTGYIYNLQSGTPTSTPNDGVVLASGNEGIIIYEDTAKRVEVGFLSAGVYGLKGYATDGTTVLFELSDTQQVIAGWNIVDGYIYNLQSGTPTSSPNDGIVLAAGNEALIIYEDTAKRVEVGYLSAGIYGLKGYATDGTTTIFELSDTQQMIAGWNFTNLVLRTGTTDANSNVLIDSGNSLFRLGPTTGDYITLDGANKRIRSSDYVSGVAGAGFTLEPDLLEVGNISARGLIRTAVFQKSVISAVGGSFAVIDSDKLNVDMTALDTSTLTISGNTTFAVGDLLRIKDGTDDEWLEVTNIASAPTYTVTRDRAAVYAANTNPAWKNGASVINYQQSGDGLIYMTASDTNAPFIAVLTHAGSPWSTITTRARLGNLNGYLGYVADIYGLGIGSNAAGEANITIEPTNGIRIRSGANNLFTVDMAGGATIGGWTLGTTTLVGGNVTLDSGGNITVGTVNNVVRLSTTDATYRLWIGHATAASAPFRVTPAGVVTASTINLTGSGVQFQGVTTGVTGTELETLTAGSSSDASALHRHPVDVQTFTANGTWTKPTAASLTLVEVICVGAGGGGSSGRRGASGSLRCGGAGGGGGSVTRCIFRIADLGATETVTVGTGGTGAAAQTVDSTDGNAGTNGTGSSFGTSLSAYGGGGTVGGGSTTGAGAGGAGIAGNASGITGGSPTVAADAVAGQGPSAQNGPSRNAEWGGGTGGVRGNGADGGSSLYGCGGGGGGGSISAANTSQAGGAGGTSQSYTAGGGGTAGTASGGSGGAGSNNTVTKKGFGADGGGGGGGGDSAGGAGGTGGTGGVPGGGGGGGGGSLNGSNSGAGGNGGNGIVYVYSY